MAAESVHFLGITAGKPLPVGQERREASREVQLVTLGQSSLFYLLCRS